MHVRFCVVPSKHAQQIAEIAREFAALDPNARRVVVAGEDDYPEERIAEAIRGSGDAGAVVLTRSGDLFAVLDVDDARNGGMIDLAFARARFA